MRSTVVLAGACLPALWLGSLAAGESPALTWLSADGSPAWRAELEPPPGAEAGAAPVPLEVGPWFPRLPDLDLDMIDDRDGLPRNLRAFDGHVLILDFWASWCEPCAQALPRLEQLHAAQRDRGLRVVTVNMKEPDEVALRFARALDLDLPVARYTEAMHETLKIDALPTVIVADGKGRIRARFDGYRSGIEERVEALAGELLADRTPTPEPVAVLLDGGGALEVRWSRDAKARVTALGVRPDPDGAVFAATDWDLITLDPAGKIRGKKRVGRGVERLRIDGTARGPGVLFGFRPVGLRVTRIPLGEAAPSAWESPANVLDLVVDPASDDGPPGVLIGALDGLHRMAGDGSPIAASEGGPVWQLARTADGVMALRTGRVEWLDGSLRPVRQVTVPETTRVLIDAGGRAEGMGVAPEQLRSVAVGSFLGDGAQAALVGPERLLVVDLDGGGVRFHAKWPGIRAVASGDLLGEGREQLIVASGTRVSVLAAPISLDVPSKRMR